MLSRFEGLDPVNALISLGLVYVTSRALIRWATGGGGKCDCDEKLCNPESPTGVQKVYQYCTAYTDNFLALDCDEVSEERCKELVEETMTEETPEGTVRISFAGDHGNWCYRSDRRNIRHHVLESAMRRFCIEHNCKDLSVVGRAVSGPSKEPEPEKADEEPEKADGKDEEPEKVDEEPDKADEEPEKEESKVDEEPEPEKPKRDVYAKLKAYGPARRNAPLRVRDSFKWLGRLEVTPKPKRRVPKELSYADFVRLAGDAVLTPTKKTQ